ncbi:MAG: pyridoxamine 5'-phosphate oxidase family protein [Chloroflexota bacterium]|nr:pyridoxamine 5'-phosphate oxidase family protein [Chloroflexota bacterium]
MLGELNRKEIDHLLRAEQLGRIGCHAAGVTYIVPVSYVFDGTCIYALSGEGMKLRMMRENPRVCFEVEQVKRWYNWQSVI